MAVEVFAVEPGAVQLCWSGLAPGAHVVAVGDAEARIVTDAGPGAIVIDGLPGATTLAVRLDGQVVASATTLAPPPGRLLSKIATIGDLHIGETAWGLLPCFRSDANPRRAHPVSCTRAAIDELLAWGADLLVVKGDLAHDNRGFEYEIAGELLGDLPIPLVVIPGNHDGGNHRNDRAEGVLARYGIELIHSTAAFDLPGARVIALDTRSPRRSGADVGPVTEAVCTAAAAAPAALVMLHHQLMTLPFPTYVPPGVLAPTSTRFLDALATAQPNAVVTAGHTHRHRARRHGPVLVTEVGSTKDYPGTWAGYYVYEGGVVQTVRRVSAPDAIAWTSRTAAMCLGLWRHWSPGRLADRCISHRWAREPAHGAARPAGAGRREPAAPPATPLAR